MGWSLGGSTAFYAAWQPIIDTLTQNGEKFAAFTYLSWTLLKPR